VVKIHYKLICGLGTFFYRKAKNASMKEYSRPLAPYTFKYLLKKLDEKTTFIAFRVFESHSLAIFWPFQKIGDGFYLFSLRTAT